MQTLTFLFAFIAVLALIGVAAWLVRRFATNRLGANTNRGRMPRLAVIDAAAVDGRRRMVLVRRDNVEHLLMIGGPSDIVVESNIVRAIPGRDQMAARPAVAGEAPPRIAPLPDANWNDEAARSDLRSADAYEHHAEPQMPEPPPRPSRPPFADEVRRPAPPPMPERRNDPLAGFAPESMGSRAEPRPEPPPPRLTRTDPLMPRPQRPSEPPKAPPPVRAPERAVAPPSPPPAPAPAQSSADQNLAEMAQRLEAALRRPAEPVAPPVAPEPPPVRAAPAPAPQKSGFENLEDEMASLLGRPKSPS
ncbi:MULTISPECIES: flagellar biosynthetic protein FliO [Bradyrhizobium]|jgi:flagellar protein FliO/FliZ|uniref:Flagellar biosynthesis protein, FliO n=2 Tax=Bradyrhizobium TaxID=374 RepID=A0ABY0QA75_9BRAD|nr:MULTISPECIES: flagellar biosynthetic protein FliO [Bradyrhizobium]SDJ77563.1 Flagellar biosynthesis protein, FliO [Bradyrhizobium ottawaense]SEC13934.1 Flagellar biosynthesis protein, FliO [Bradyrhizobium lablabi]SHM76529.1 Flagellar biosynthesis protein, FliO [Bradyrhizobium lablabi]